MLVGLSIVQAHETLVTGRVDQCTKLPPAEMTAKGKQIPGWTCMGGRLQCVVLCSAGAFSPGRILAMYILIFFEFAPLSALSYISLPFVCCKLRVLWARVRLFRKTWYRAIICKETRPRTQSCSTLLDLTTIILRNTKRAGSTGRFQCKTMVVRLCMFRSAGAFSPGRNTASVRYGFLVGTSSASCLAFASCGA